MDGPRACKVQEFDEVISLINMVFREGSDQDIVSDYPLVFNRPMADYMRIVKVDGKVVSHVPVAPREIVAENDRFIVGIISPTVTHPAYRHRGYGSLCLRDCVKIMENQNWPLSALWTQEATFPFYQNSGWEVVGCQGWMYWLDSSDTNLFLNNNVYEISMYDKNNPQHIQNIIGIHDDESHRVYRSISDYQTLFSLPKITTYIASSDGKFAAYITLGKGSNKPGIIESGGDVKALECLINHVLVENDTSIIQLLTPLTKTKLGMLMDSKKPEAKQPIERAQGVGFQMMRVNSLIGLLKRMAGQLQKKSGMISGSVCITCEDNGETVSINIKDGLLEISPERTSNEVVLSRRQLTSLIFGNHEIVKSPAIKGKAGLLLKSLFPIYFPIWELDHS